MLFVKINYFGLSFKQLILKTDLMQNWMCYLKKVVIGPTWVEVHVFPVKGCTICRLFIS